MMRTGAGSPRRYVCAFRGRRDYYQLPVALAEGNMLEEFISDAYRTPWLRTLEDLLPPRARTKLEFRYESGIPDERITCLWGTTAVEHLRHRLGMTPFATFARLDRRFSLAAAARARETRSDLLLYAPYAWEAFRTSYRHIPRRVLFQYHPHPDAERRILLEDSAKYHYFRYSYEEEMGDGVSEQIKQRNRDCWQYADLILCASEFTKWSLVEAGADPNLCQVVPYGIEVPARPVEHEAPDSFRVLFVGSGTQRKGLHHLLLAWQKARVPAGSQLTLVCRYLDSGLEALIRTTPSTRLVRGVGAQELDELFQRSTLFVMPSLVEGFGQVFLEALAQGCPVLGTPQTCLPELGAPNDAIRFVEPGRIEELVAELERLGETLPGNRSIRRLARETVERWPWERFREGVRSALRSE